MLYNYRAGMPILIYRVRRDIPQEKKFKGDRRNI